MAGSHASVLEAIGNTPIAELNRYGAGAEPLLLAGQIRRVRYGIDGQRLNTGQLRPQ